MVSQKVSPEDSPSDRDQPYLVIDNVRKQFPRRGEPPLTVIDGLNVAEEHGSLLSVLGPSGCWPATGRPVRFATHNLRAAVFLSTVMLLFTAPPWSTHTPMALAVRYPRVPE